MQRCTRVCTTTSDGRFATATTNSSKHVDTFANQSSVDATYTFRLTDLDFQSRTHVEGVQEVAFFSTYSIFESLPRLGRFVGLSKNQLEGDGQSSAAVPTVSSARAAFLYIFRSTFNLINNCFQTAFNWLSRVEPTRVESRRAPLQEHVGSDRDCGRNFCEYTWAKGGVVARGN